MSYDVTLLDESTAIDLMSEKVMYMNQINQIFT